MRSYAYVIYVAFQSSMQCAVCTRFGIQLILLGHAAQCF